MTNNESQWQNHSSRQEQSLKIHSSSLHPSISILLSRIYTTNYTCTASYTLPPPTPLHKSHPTTQTVSYRLLAQSQTSKFPSFLLLLQNLQRNFPSLIHHRYFSLLTASTPRFPPLPLICCQTQIFFVPQSWLPTAIFQTKSPSPDRLC